jgi:hypothetical protein
MERRRFFDDLVGRSLTPARRLAVAALILAQIVAQYEMRRGRPVPGEERRFFRWEIGYQNVDALSWVETGMLLPRSAVDFRAHRPLYPAILMVARWFGLVHSGPWKEVFSAHARVLKAANGLLAFAALWIFFAVACFFGMDTGSAVCATVLAGSGFGFSFFVSQAIPEVLSYTSLIVFVAAMILAEERLARTSKPAPPEARVWGIVGLLLGVILLGKELYGFVLLGLAVLALRRRGLRTAGAFVGAAALPTLLWTLYISWMHFPQRNVDLSHAAWIWTTLLPADLLRQYGLIAANLSDQVTAFLEAFVYLPVFFMVIGMLKRPVQGQGRYLAAFFCSIAAMYFAYGEVHPRSWFLAWPVVYFFGWQGIEVAGDWMAALFIRTEGASPPRAASSAAFALLMLAILVWLQNQMLYRVYFYG